MTAWTCQRQTAGKAAQKIVPLLPRTPCWKGLGADSEEKREPVSDINTALVDSLKVLDSKRPIREAVIPSRSNIRNLAPGAFSLGRSSSARRQCLCPAWWSA